MIERMRAEDAAALSPAAGVAEACLTDRMRGEAAACGRVHSTFAHAVNVALALSSGDKRLLTAVVAGTYLPDSLQMAEADFLRLQACAQGVPVRWTATSFSHPNGAVTLARSPWTGKMPAGLVRAPAMLRALSARDDLRLNVPESARATVREGIEGVLSALRARCPERAAEESLRLIGLGGGLTPAADDALTGALAVCYRAGIGGTFLTSDLLARTTDVSAKYLQCAQEGFFSKRMLDLWEATEPTLPLAIERAAQWGASSGRDMLWGMRVALERLRITDETE